MTMLSVVIPAYNEGLRLNFTVNEIIRHLKGKKFEILIIDDDEIQLMLLRSILSSKGYSVHSTADGPQGVLLYKIQHPDLVLLDIGLPSMSGIEVLKQIRQIDQKAKVIVITGYASVESAVLAIRSGAWVPSSVPRHWNSCRKSTPMMRGSRSWQTTLRRNHQPENMT